MLEFWSAELDSFPLPCPSTPNETSSVLLVLHLQPSLLSASYSSLPFCSLPLVLSWSSVVLAAVPEARVIRSESTFDERVECRQEGARGGQRRGGMNMLSVWYTYFAGDLRRRGARRSLWWRLSGLGAARPPDCLKLIQNVRPPPHLSLSKSYWRATGPEQVSPRLHSAPTTPPLILPHTT